LEKGAYNQITDKRPSLTYKTLLTEQIVRDNLPELTLEEKILVKMETMDIPKDKAAQSLIDGKAQQAEFKMLEA
jgi:hypothetical protein